MYHYRKQHRAYSSYPKPESCSFCDFEKLQNEIVKQTDHTLVVPNRTFYDMWELRKVVDHLLVIPKVHVESLADLESVHRHDIIDTIAAYEAEGYHVYARAPGSSQKSVIHQHTHLIKTIDKPARATVYLRKPYMLIKF